MALLKSRKSEVYATCTWSKKLIIILCCLFLICRAESNIPIVNHFGYEHGINSLNIRSITQDQSGYMWFGTVKGLYQFDGYNFNQNHTEPILKNAHITVLYNTSDGALWAGTKYSGLYRYFQHEWSHIQLRKDDIKKDITGVKELSNGPVVISTHDGLYQFKQNVEAQLEHNPVEQIIEDIKINDFVEIDQQQLLLATFQSVTIYDLVSKKREKIELNIDREITTLHVDNNSQIWIGGKQFLYRFDLQSRQLIPIVEVNDALSHDPISWVMSIVSDQNIVWVATLMTGIFKIDLITGEVLQYNKKPDSNSFISDSNASLYLSDGILWVGSFAEGVDQLNMESLRFKFEFHDNESFDCIEKFDFRRTVFDEDIQWVSGTYGLIKRKVRDKSCQLFTYKRKQLGVESPMYNLLIEDTVIWVSTAHGVEKFDLSSETFLPTNSKFPEEFIYFVTPLRGHKRYFGGYFGLYEYDESIDAVKNISAGVTPDGTYFNDYLITSSGDLFFTGNNGLFSMDSMGQLNKMYWESVYQNQRIVRSFIDLEDRMYLSINNVGLIVLNQGLDVEQIFGEEQGVDKKYIYSIFVQGQNIWLGTNNGLINLSMEGRAHKTYFPQDGPNIRNFFKLAGADKQGNLYFSGDTGMVHFNPKDLKFTGFKGHVVINQLSIINQEVKPGVQQATGFILDRPINHTKQIELGYKDYLVELGFAGLDYTDSARNQYAYRLKGLYDEWIYTSADNRKATYTSLKPGNYVFQVKAANKEGIWSEQIKELKVKVYPAPWFSPWAYAAYVLILLMSIWAFIRYKTMASRKRAAQLEVTVAERTQEVVQQKRMVESLLDHKNEVFANITHEFKTPLALILGPVEEIVNEPELNKFSSQLTMVQRNAKRLLLMVGQILKLSQAEQDKEVIREAQAVQPILLMLFESFSPIAKDKNIVLTLENDHEVNVYATSECLETVLGNLISNAIKYSNRGGRINIQSFVDGDQVTISVKDNGPGIKAQDIDKIFKRFTRLDVHKTTQGTGIGLSVVKEVTEANKGHVKVDSQWGTGSEFSVTFPVTQLNADGELSRAMTDQLVSNLTTELVESEKPSNTASKTHAVTVLIIEDNLDVQKHIGSVLRVHFNCLFADRGDMGIALALKEVPDIIICDVMMPGMDGYQVTRILRHDERTSHIPIILLTALNTKESRVKGWCENIDRYMAKPFDGTELIVQLKSILNIRQLLQQKTNQVIHEQGALNTLDLSKQDLKFIEKLQDMIVQYYSNEYFQKADLANKMAISERQLQRKVKALIGVGPLDMLRDYRLEQSKLKLKDGYQVSRVSVDCGFGSTSYFSTCFKKKYGMTPKQYQQLD